MESSRASVTSRALALLGAFDGEHRRLTLSDLARRAGLPLATAHRLAGEPPVRGPDGEVIAALGLVVPDLRRQQPRLVSALRVTAQGIGRTIFH
ncbi:helix-turn-helix domain-containing protein [Dactylosporangium sp. CA-139066]|uniref:helix-turn-helix domain-containing protein n=1 Tax=Dactylosporangium sp. CA-139066 TaxID=3239930 RepID=UPI003D8FCC7F